MTDTDIDTNPPWIGIAPMRIELLESYHKCLDSVCREKRYLMFSEAPPLHMSRAFVQELLEDRMPMTVAFIPGPTVIGWCDISRLQLQSQNHVGRLGMAVHKQFRNQGLGSLLMERTLKAAHACYLERIELEVFGSNQRAIDLYRSFEFEEEGLKRRARKMDGVYEDIVIMARYF